MKMTKNRKWLAVIAGGLAASALAGGVWQMIRTFGERAEMRRAVNKLKRQGNWQMIKGRLQRKYGQLADEDLMLAYGKEKEFIGNLKKKLGMRTREVTELINKL